MAVRTSTPPTTDPPMIHPLVDEVLDEELLGEEVGGGASEVPTDVMVTTWFPDVTVTTEVTGTIEDVAEEMDETLLSD